MSIQLTTLSAERNIIWSVCVLFVNWAAIWQVSDRLTWIETKQTRIEFVVAQVNRSAWKDPAMPSSSKLFQEQATLVQLRWEQVNLQGDLSRLRQANQELTRELDLARAHFPLFVNPPSPLQRYPPLSIITEDQRQKKTPKDDKVQQAKWGKTKFLLFINKSKH